MVRLFVVGLLFCSFGLAVVRVQCGGPGGVDPQSKVWNADTGFTGGYSWTSLDQPALASQPAPFNAMRASRGGPFSYTLTPPPGQPFVTVTLAFIEPNKTAAGQRVFSVSINKVVVIPALDLFTTAGLLTPWTTTLPVSGPGPVTVTLTPITGNALLSGIQANGASAPAMYSKVFSGGNEYQPQEGCIKGITVPASAFAAGAPVPIATVPDNWVPRLVQVEETAVFTSSSPQVTTLTAAVGTLASPEYYLQPMFLMLPAPNFRSDSSGQAAQLTSHTLYLTVAVPGLNPGLLASLTAGSLTVKVCGVQLLSASTPIAQIMNVAVLGATSTQVALHYTAPDNNPCELKFSDSPTMAPLVHDVDASLFPGANLDNRPGSVTNGTDRLVVVGKRAAERDSHLRMTSRALQLFTPHYFQINCGASHAAGTASTTNIPIGNTYNDELPADPATNGTGDYTGAGKYAWPDFTSWDNKDPNARKEEIVDPDKGMLTKRVTLPQDQPTLNPPAGDHAFSAAIDRDSAWLNPANAITGAAPPATFTGPGRNWLFLQAGPVDFNVYGFESEVLQLLAWCGGACAGEDAKAEACKTVNRMACWGNTIEITLATQANPSVFVSAGGAAAYLTGWTPQGSQGISVTDIKARSGWVDVDTTGTVTWTVAGDWFYPNWMLGSKITIAGIECTIASVTNPQTLTILPSSCPALSLPQSRVPYSAMNFGTLIRKKTASLDQINIQYAKYTWQASNPVGWPSSGAPTVCSPTQTLNAVTGELGYHCIFAGNIPNVYWIGHDTGNANYLGMWTVGGGDGPDGWFHGGCGNDSITLSGKGPTDPETYYCIVPSRSGKMSVLGCSMTSTNQPGSLNAGCGNMTPGSTGKDLASLIVAFTANQAVPYDPAKYGGCNISAIQNGRLLMPCNRGNQDSTSWTVVFDPNKIGTDAGCVGGGAPGCVVAAGNTWSGPGPNQWCVNHTLFGSGNSDTAWQSGKFFSGGVNTPGARPQTSAILSGPLGPSGALAPGTGTCPAGVLRCDVIHVDGEPCNNQPYNGEGNNGTCAKDNAQEGLRNASVGDVGYIMPARTELTQIVNKAPGDNWTIARGYGGSTPAAASGSIYFDEQCLANHWGTTINASWLWDYMADPHELNANGLTVRRVPYDYDHPTPRAHVVVGDGSNGYAVGTSPDALPVLFSPLGPAFAGATGIAVFGESAQPHVSHPQDTAPASEQNWFLDSRPLSTPGWQLVDEAVKISGQLYKFASTTTDGDTLRNIGGPNAEFGGLDRKKQPTMAYCGTQPLIDISSSTMGDVISDLQDSAYRYCIARRGGECRKSSVMGDIYANCPFLSQRPAFSGYHADHPAPSYGCWYQNGEGTLANDLCLYNTGAYLNSVIQVGYAHNDPVGALGRALTKRFIRYHLDNPNDNVRTLPDGSWLLYQGGSGVMAAKMPPFPAEDGINRQTFVPIVIPLSPPVGLGITNAIIEHGYAENGPAEAHFCTTRKDPCVDVTAAVPDPAFLFPGDGAGGVLSGVTGMPCAAGCSIAIPAIPQRVVYYRVMYRDAANRVVSTSPVQVAVSP